MILGQEGRRTLEGDDASSLRWRFAEKPDPFLVEWYGVDDQIAFETDGLIGDPATASKVLEFRPSKIGETTFMLELVEQDPTKRTEPPAKRLEFTFSVCYEPAQVITSGGGCPSAPVRQARAASELRRASPGIPSEARNRPPRGPHPT